MDWRKTKTIFIITFLVLNVYLGQKILEKRERNQLDFLAEATMEEQFEADEITYAELPKAPSKDSYISGRSYVFTDDDVKELDGKDQIVERVDETKLKGIWKEPIPFTDTTVTRINTFFQEQILFADQYTFWGQDALTNSLIFYQQFNGKHIYRNSSGMVTIYLNELMEMVSYEQTFITDLEEMDVEQDIISAFTAISNLYESGDLRTGHHVGHMELGYYTLVDSDYSSSHVHVLIPTWHIVLNQEQDIFVNAFEGSILKRESRKLE
ncbi:two-component system regulatory protein YycI [Sutcliffiella rhizosphaerae]|uniref:Two-component system WalR/WalK regulatory protein YycI n=1 Tax=Sutcliffiella rhizosphaerae TaxID=2880967 RepID=A0ABN8AFL7_9BACI|nr:two-component system regulatory protein YycI [Sutcliffiella rhizosphaerae]CAG9622907.1 Two-component system WalR/WalK regulatory protein YycI [Sutcliffiella rhizosphaerae]